MKLLVLFVLFCGAMAQTEEGPWKMFNGKSYGYFATAQTWANAQFHCLMMGGHLAVSSNKQEEDYVKELAGGEAAWIGLSDAQQTGYWFWINSEPMSYTSWCPGKPTDKIEHCVGINYSELKCWKDYRCETLLPYVCERN